MMRLRRAPEPPPVTIRPPVPERANSATPRSISSASRTPTGVSSTPSACAPDWIAANWPTPATDVELRKTAARVMLGATCLSNSTHLPPKLYSKLVKPVALPPGRARLCTHPAPTGGNRLHGDRWVNLHDERHADDAANRCDIADKIEIELLVERRVDRVGRADQQERVAVRRRIHDAFGGDIATGARPIVDDNLLTEPLGEPLRHHPRRNVGRTASRKPNNQAHRSRRVGLRRCDARESRERRGTCCQMQKLSARKFHRAPLRGLSAA